ncbi:hypothetical protein PR202_ga30550 [Eleusine coracana subsp. coracana]|uniref:Kinesin motor domain-containing protein n=1 Tax=Eleusine coracana subsp. coracana TaxID=191504 RepID=A0AAV5DMU9_ELECO|nr:hypothetical protein PR202_ga30550 [Eleusine coracana subsp. coracana]
MTGPENATEKEWGVNYRALNDLFHISRNRGDTIIQPNGLAVPDATLHPVNSSTDVIELMRTGLANRAVGSTALNDRSSRSHSYFVCGALHLVDLAGSERVDRSAVTGDRLKEAQHINKSLSALGDVIFSLSQKNAHVPYRNSKLTQINPDVSSYSETLSTLKFAERVSGVELGAAKANKEGKDIRELMEQLSLLKHKIAMKDEEISKFQLLGTQTPKARTAKQGDYWTSRALSIDEMAQNSADPDLSCFGYAESEERLSDISDSGLSMGTETDGSISSVVELTLFPEQEKPSSSMKEQEKAPRTPNDRLVSRKSRYNTSNVCITNIQHSKAMDVARV